MKRNYKYLIISFLVCLPFWWGVNVLGSNLEGFLFLRQISRNPNILNAAMSESLNQLKLSEIKLEKAREERLSNLDIVAESAIVLDIDSAGNSSILFDKRGGEAKPIASLTKLMTALIVFDLNETYNFSQIIKITKEVVEQEGSSKYGDLRMGDRLSVENLLYTMLIESSNDAAFALTEPITEKAFVDLMNIKAREIGLNNTYFANATGLDPDNPKNSVNISSAEDLAKLADYILKNQPGIFKITANKSYMVLNPDRSVHHFISQNTNELLSEYPEIIGGKTGQTPMAQECLLEVVKKPNDQGYYISVVLASSDRFADTRQILDALI